MSARSSAELAEDYLTAHTARDLAGVLALFQEDAVLEDPVGSDPHRGLESIRAFFAAAHERNGRLRVERVGPVLACGLEASWHIRAAAETAGFDPTVDVIYTLRAGPDGRIASLRAYFDMGSV